MEETVKQETKAKPCCCVAMVGALVIVFAWWKVGWGEVALTVLGAVIILRELAGKCCCSSICKK